MKKLALFLLIAIASINISKAQNTNLVFFSEQGERFSVILNGILQNPKPETNVKVTGLNASYYKTKVIFEDAKLGVIDKTVNFNLNSETTFCIKKNNKGEYVIRWQSEVPIAQALPQNNNQTSVTYTTTTPIVNSSSSNIQTTTTTVNSTNNVDPNGASIGMNINDPNNGVNINMNVNANMGNANTTTSTYSSTTTTTTSSNVNNNQVANNNQPVYVLQGYNGPVGCPYPMSESDFNGVKNSISSKSFEDSKLTIAKQVISSNCLLSSQVKEIMMLFSFEDSRLDLAKYAYGYTFDIGNYYKLNDAFKFESSIDELNAYISSKK
ncbi:MAG: DUF4476 domain-containing protein [Bacteroidetes bacterium]|nr:DUF4476 domain-containing protein [Bacteroidota bacterium]